MKIEFFRIERDGVMIPLEPARATDQISQADWLDLKNRLAYALQDESGCCILTRKQILMLYRTVDLMLCLDLPEELRG